MILQWPYCSFLCKNQNFWHCSGMKGDSTYVYLYTYLCFPSPSRSSSAWESAKCAQDGCFIYHHSCTLHHRTTSRLQGCAKLYIRARVCGVSARALTPVSDASSWGEAGRSTSTDSLLGWRSTGPRGEWALHTPLRDLSTVEPGRDPLGCLWNGAYIPA